MRSTSPISHFIDEQTGKVYDVPWETLRVAGAESLRRFKVSGVSGRASRPQRNK
jgi:hypothetical protein